MIAEFPRRALRSAATAMIVWMISASSFAAGTSTASVPSATSSTAKVKIVLIGDSTVEVSSGWGPGFAKCLTPEATCVNWARGGRSSKSFVAEGLWKKALAEKPDYVLIQFGHNDQPGKGPERETDPKTTYPEQMGKYVDEARAAGATPVLITSLTRRTFGSDGKIKSSLVDYVEAVKKLAQEKKVPLIDLHARSIELVEKLGPRESEQFDPAPKPDAQDKRADKTHLTPKGQEVFGRMVVEELKKAAPSLAPYIR
ncbi:MAG: rhamnogalacturonan acetylesterase [Candidatus Sumerlaeota bacterium]|nr:rhamnogalacturonan acetylesterase [Candidatus Sumerlaeota bacterium]